MPGIFGGIGKLDLKLDDLRSEFSAAWPDHEFRGTGRAGVGGHAFGSQSSLREPGDGTILAIDGEHGLYQTTGQQLASLEVKSPSSLLRHLPLSTGNVAVLDPRGRSIALATDCSGVFPLYYASSANGFLFSSLLRPIRRVVESPIDPVGMLQFLRKGYTYADRTQFKDVKRILPGQVITYDAERGMLMIRETSRAWIGSPVGSPDLLEAVWDQLEQGLTGSIGEDASWSLMLSGGWDSRTLLAVAKPSDLSGGLHLYAHGDVRSRELTLVHEIARQSGFPCRLEPIDGRVLDPDMLAKGFKRSGTAVFPHWLRAGRNLSESGIVCSSSGIYGEVFGGHYGPAMREHGLAKILRVARTLTGTGRELDYKRAQELLLSGPAGTHWYLQRHFERSLADPTESINEDVRKSIARLIERGVEDGERLIEAFIAEHRGAQYIGAQAISCRAEVDISVPFANRDFLSLVTQLPLRSRIHNRLNRLMLRRFSPELLRFSLAATLIPASAPIFLQEASRAIRKGGESFAWRRYLRSPGRRPPPRLGWVNFEFLSRDDALRNLVADLRADIWDRGALMESIEVAERMGDFRRLHPLFDQISKVYTADLLLR